MWLQKTERNTIYLGVQVLKELAKQIKSGLRQKKKRRVGDILPLQTVKGSKILNNMVFHTYIDKEVFCVNIANRNPKGYL